jgi:hypothetical protein
MTSTTDFYTLPPTKHQQLRALNTHTQPIQEALNHAQASVARAMLLVQREYLQRRQHILNGHDEEALR